MTDQNAINGLTLMQGAGLNDVGQNQDMVTGNGWLGTRLRLVNGAGGVLRLDPGQRLRFTGTDHLNGGRVELRGGSEVQVTGSFGDASGRFDRIDAAGLVLAAGTALDTSPL